MRFGRMERRLDEVRGKHIVRALEGPTEKKMPDSVVGVLARGSNELDLVRSGLDDTMRLAYQEIRETKAAHTEVKDYRTAA